VTPPVDQFRHGQADTSASLGGPAGDPTPHAATGRGWARWPVLLLAAPAFVAIWSGWVGLGGLTGFGVVQLLPGWSDYELDTAITLPIGMETYAAYAIHVWLSGRAPERARRFARRSAIGALILGGLGQVAFHLMTAAGWDTAPWPITMAVSCVPIAVVGMGTALTSLLRAEPDTAPTPVATPDTRPDTAPVVAAPVTPSAAAEPDTDTPPTPPRTPTPHTDNPTRIAELRRTHPDMTQAEVAARLAISERTVTRHWKTTRPTLSAVRGA
jgi:hypothetical protein